MPYNVAKDSAFHTPTQRTTFGSLARQITPSGSDLDPYPKSVCLGAFGDITYLPAANADAGPTVTLTGLSPGVPVPHRVRRVIAASATVYTVEDN